MMGAAIAPVATSTACPRPDRSDRTPGPTVALTVNDPAVMKRLIEMGADGIITDYPDKAIKTLDH